MRDITAISSCFTAITVLGQDHVFVTTTQLPIFCRFVGWRGLVSFIVVSCRYGRGHVAVHMHTANCILTSHFGRAAFPPKQPDDAQFDSTQIFAALLTACSDKLYASASQRVQQANISQAAAEKLPGAHAHRLYFAYAVAQRCGSSGAQSSLSGQSGWPALALARSLPWACCAAT